jgi:hypothetical protein
MDGHSCGDVFSIFVPMCNAFKDARKQQRSAKISRLVALAALATAFGGLVLDSLLLMLAGTVLCFSLALVGHLFARRRDKLLAFANSSLNKLEQLGFDMDDIMSASDRIYK